MSKIDFYAGKSKKCLWNTEKAWKDINLPLIMFSVHFTKWNDEIKNSLREKSPRRSTKKKSFWVMPFGITVYSTEYPLGITQFQQSAFGHLAHWSIFEICQNLVLHLWKFFYCYHLGYIFLCFLYKNGTDGYNPNVYLMHV